MWFARVRSEEQHFQWNFLPLLEKMRAVCATWSNRTLSLKGKVAVYNSLVNSQIQYVNASSCTPPKALIETKKIATSFLWSGKKSKIAYHSIIQKIEDGGLRLMDLSCRTKANHVGWIKRILGQPNGTAAEMIRNILKEEDISLALAFRRNPTSLPYGISPFYRAVLSTWFQARDNNPTTELEIHSQVIWENHWISSPQHFLRRELWKRWIEAGIIIINDICHDTENRLLGHEEINEKFHIRCNFLDALTICNSIPHAWRSQLTASFQEEVSYSHSIHINGT